MQFNQTVTFVFNYLNVSKDFNFNINFPLAWEEQSSPMLAVDPNIFFLIHHLGIFPHILHL